jgi:hypothetical protein
VLIRAGLLAARSDGDGVEVEATEALLQLFDAVPPLERLYPLLVEVVMDHAQERAGFLVGEKSLVDRRLRLLGMTEEGLWRLKCRIASA